MEFEKSIPKKKKNILILNLFGAKYLTVCGQLNVRQEGRLFLTSQINRNSFHSLFLSMIIHTLRRMVHFQSLYNHLSTTKYRSYFSSLVACALQNFNYSIYFCFLCYVYDIAIQLLVSKSKTVSFFIYVYIQINQTFFFLSFF